MKAICFLLIMFQGLSFKNVQLQQSRVKLAYQQKEQTVQQFFKSKKLNYIGCKLFIRAFKKENVLEVWAKDATHDTYSLLTTYDFCSSSGTPGPKRREGDQQIPEGLYYINHFNPQSNFYLSLGLNYPNASDKILSDQHHPGGSIYIHGNCVTIGCIPITDDKIKELYVLAVEARNNGQEKIPVHIFPARLTAASLATLKNAAPKNGAFWENLKSVFDDFEQHKKLKTYKINSKGEYVFTP